MIWEACGQFYHALKQHVFLCELAEGASFFLAGCLYFVGSHEGIPGTGTEKAQCISRRACWALTGTLGGKGHDVHDGIHFTTVVEVATPFPEGEPGKKGVFGSAVPLNFLSEWVWSVSCIYGNGVRNASMMKQGRGPGRAAPAARRVQGIFMKKYV